MSEQRSVIEIVKSHGYKIVIEPYMYCLISLTRDEKKKTIWENDELTFGEEHIVGSDLYKEIFNFNDSEIYFLKNGLLKKEVDFINKVAKTAGIVMLDVIEYDSGFKRKDFFQENNKEMFEEQKNFSYEERMEKIDELREFCNFYGDMLQLNSLELNNCCKIYFDKQENSLTDRIIGELLFLRETFSIEERVEWTIKQITRYCKVLAFEIKKQYNVDIPVDEKDIEKRYTEVYEGIDKKINTVNPNRIKIII